MVGRSVSIPNAHRVCALSWSAAPQASRLAGESRQAAAAANAGSPEEAKAKLDAAWEAGADIVKLFPADIGGPAYLKAIKAPLPQVSIAPTGGVDLNNAGEFIRAGADALGVGSSLVNNKLLEAGDFTAITERARRFREAVDAGRREAG